MTAPPAAPTSSAERRITAIRRTLEGVLGIPATEGNAIDVLRNGDEIFPALLESIAAAGKTIDFLTFVYWEGEIGRRFAEALAERAEDGVRVRVLLDGFGALSIEKKLLDLMTGAGVDVQWFRRLGRMQPHKANHRTHRKVLVVDEEVAFTGGVGIADEWLGDARDPSEWRDTHFRLRGPAVDGLRAAFLNNWVEAEGALFDRDVDRFPDQPQPGSAVVQCVRGASSTGWSDVSTLFRTLLAVAEQRVRIATAYFVPDERLSDQLCAAADRNVKLDILIPGPHIDKRLVQLAGEASYERLLEHGIGLWRYQPSMLHAKIMTVDGVVANIGSANMNARSARLDEEINVVVLEPDLVGVLDAHFDQDLERSERVAPGGWHERSLPQRTLELGARLLRREL